MSIIRAVVFDIGGVMIRLAPGWEKACRASGVIYRPFEETPDYKANLRVLELDYGCGRITPDEYFARLDCLVNGLYPPEDLRALHQAIIQEEFPGIYDLVRDLRASGYFTACLSNTCASHWVALGDPALYPAIGSLDARFASQQLGVMKPDEAIFRHFEAHTGFAPAEILFFDDLADNVAAAQSCGWEAVRIMPADNAVPQLRDALAQYAVLPVAP
jgi:putative hydrolase of the HAD superfamily